MLGPANTQKRKKGTEIFYRRSVAKLKYHPKIHMNMQQKKTSQGKRTRKWKF